MEVIETLTPEEAAQILRKKGMRTTPVTLRAGIEQNRFPFGDLLEPNAGGPCAIYIARCLKSGLTNARHKKILNMNNKMGHLGVAGRGNTLSTLFTALALLTAIPLMTDNWDRWPAVWVMTGFWLLMALATAPKEGNDGPGKRV